LERTFTHTVEAFVTALEEKDTYTAGHSERVAEFALATARELGLDAEQCRLVHQGGRLHDIGKISLHADDLNKAGPLTAEEYARFKEHPAIGEALMRPIPTFRDVLPAIGAHHERWDGAGYPRGLAGEDIPFIARIMAVADTYDAMTSNRAYRAALKHSVALAEIRRCSGSQFDPKVVDAFLAAIETWRERRKREGLDYPR
jgi:putative nucleotidyltransferase with HDIG domain